MGLFKILFSIALLFILTDKTYSKFNMMKIMEKVESFANSINDKRLKFSYQNCGPTNDPFKVNNLSVNPDPVQLPGNLTLNGSASITNNITDPLTLSLKLIKIIGPLKIEIPCVNNVGSCVYEDVCALLPTPDNCPDFFKQHNIPCTCPFTVGDYSAQNLEIEIDLPDKIPSGQYNVIANFVSKQIGHVGCVNINLNIA